jgi:hypothetical protein
MELRPVLPSERLGSPSLPRGWEAAENALGGVDLYVPDPRHARRYIAAGSSILAAIAGWQTLASFPMTPKTSAPVWLAITLLLILFALWCAFADERWRVAKNSLGRRLSIGGYAHTSHYRDAELEIVCRRDSRGKPYYRLYAVANGKPHFLIERDEEALCQLAAFISFHTGWPVRSSNAFY